MNGHTPGPWVDKRDTGLRHRIQSVSGGTLAYMTARPLAYGANFSHEQIAANARLIAAAPELLKELQHLVKLLEWPIDDGRVSVPGLATLNAARLAIAKATGAA